MKRRVLLLLGAASMSAASVVGTSAITATPAAAQTFNPGASIGYVIGLFGCVFNGIAAPATVGDCLRANLRGLLGSLGLPAGFPSGNAGAAGPTAPGSNAPSLKLPTNVSGFLRTLPPALQTNPVADAVAPAAPIRQLVPAPVLNTGLSTSAPSVTERIKSSLPKVPTPAEISLFNISDNAPVDNSGAPISGADVLQLIALGAVGAAGVTAVTRRRMAAVRS